MTGVAGVLEFFGDLVTEVIGWGTQIITWFIDQPLLLVPIFIFFIVGGTIGIVRRAMGQ